jgi:macrolide transport system ATP-binding/permease protein
VMNAFFQDTRYALRQLRKSPGFTIVAVLTLALGVCSSVAIFAFVDAALIKPLPYQDPSRLVGLYESIPLGPRFHLSYPDYVDWKSLNKVFSDFDVYENDGFMISTPDGVERANGARVSDGFFRTLGVTPVVGRDFRPGESEPSAARTVLLSYSAWQKRYGGRNDVLGQTVVLDDKPHTIIGVLPADFHFAPAEPAEFWSTALEASRTCRGCHSLYGVARLKTGVSFLTAFADIQSIAKQLEQNYPDSNRDQAAFMLPLATVIVGDIRPILLVSLTGAGLLLLIACVNIASLLLVRSEGRRREWAVRGALGASTTRLFLQFVADGLVLAAIGGGVGIASALGAIRLLSRLLPKDMMASMPFLVGLGLNVPIVVFTIAISTIAVVFFSLMPALRLRSSTVREDLAEGGRAAAGTAWRRIGANLVVVELAMAMLLLTGGGLLVKSFYRLLRSDIGMQPGNLATLEVSPSTSAYSKPEKALALEKEILARVRSLPGVQSVTSTNRLPLGDADFTTQFVVLGRAGDGRHDEVTYRIVSSGFFSTVRSRLLDGRYFEEAEDSRKPRVAVINRAMARQFFGGENPIGKRINYSGGKADSAMEIIGVVDDIKEGQLDTLLRSTCYVPFNQNPLPFFSLIVRTAQTPESLLPQISSVVHQYDPSLAAFGGTTMTDRIHDSPSAYLHRSSAWLVGSFALLALLLSALGLYGVVAYSVGQRTREIGVRMALGAQRNSVYRLVLKEAGWLVGLGIAAGTLFSLGSTILIEKLLFGVRAWDVSTLASVAAVLGATALLASYLPARRAAKVDPMVALRYE